MEGLKGEGEPLPLVLWTVTDEIRTLLRLQSGIEQGRPLGALMKELRIRGPRERLIGLALQRLRGSVLRQALQDAAQADRIVKGLRAPAHAGDPWDALMQLALRIARG